MVDLQEEYILCLGDFVSNGRKIQKITSRSVLPEAVQKYRRFDGAVITETKRLRGN